ncbi:hypothetical protein M408DRAFT_162973 [Serendipita vermifera MAFF 305830]|uniref:Uncharacterized protein n=1 Tax=Serendipita vermifera MAFF 305830 TaxID=933852 RepID=A0A0C2XEZ2_SERVB|nr:hypothetical protein M408DRAFT_162973 [Serendipita vermifera MAFF 305830]
MGPLLTHGLLAALLGHEDTANGVRKHGVRDQKVVLSSPNDGHSCSRNPSYHHSAFMWLPSTVTPLLMPTSLFAIDLVTLFPDPNSRKAACRDFNFRFWRKQTRNFQIGIAPFLASAVWSSPTIYLWSS